MNLQGKWRATTSGEHSEVTPVDDLKPHTNGATCKYGPRVDGKLIIHHSYDRREFAEQNGALIQ